MLKHIFYLNLASTPLKRAVVLYQQNTIQMSKKKVNNQMIITERRRIETRRKREQQREKARRTESDKEQKDTHTQTSDDTPWVLFRVFDHSKRTYLKLTNRIEAM